MTAERAAMVFFSGGADGMSAEGLVVGLGLAECPRCRARRLLVAASAHGFRQHPLTFSSTRNDVASKTSPGDFGHKC